MGDISFPFERESSPFPMPPGHHHLSAGVVVVALTINTTLGGVLPAVGFRFARVDGSGFYPLVVLAADDPNDLRALPELVARAVTAALDEAGV